MRSLEIVESFYSTSSVIQSPVCFFIFKSVRVTKVKGIYG